MTTQYRRLIGIVVVVFSLLLIPLIAMQFTDQVDWSPFDFMIAGFLLLGAGLLFELVLRTIKQIEYRIAVGLAILIALVLVWAELAVGIFGTPFGGS